MNRFIVIVALLASSINVSAGPRYATEAEWDRCIEQVEDELFAKGQCGASSCRNDGGFDQGDICIARVGYPRSSEAEADAIIKEIKEVGLSGWARRAASVFPPEHRIHVVVMEAEAAEAKERAQWEASQKPDIQIRSYTATDIWVNN